MTLANLNGRVEIDEVDANIPGQTIVLGHHSLYGSGRVVVRKMSFGADGYASIRYGSLFDATAVQQVGVVVPVYGVGLVPFTFADWQTSPPQA